MAWSQASAVALPAIMIEREATLGVPAGTSSLSPSHQPHRAGVDAEPLGDQRHERGEMPLPHRLRAGAQRHLAVRLEPQIDGFVENAAGDLEEAADADAAQLAVPLGRRAPRRKAVPVGQRQRPVQDASRKSPLS